MFLSVNSATALASAKVPCDAGNLSQAHKDMISEGRDQEQDMSADSTAPECPVLFSCQHEKEGM